MPTLVSSQFTTPKSGSVSQEKIWIDTSCGTDQTNISTVVMMIFTGFDTRPSSSATSIARPTDTATVTTVKITVRSVTVMKSWLVRTDAYSLKPAKAGVR